MPKLGRLSIALASTLALSSLTVGCTSEPEPTTQTDDITDVKHTDVERQSIGNCWLYATASWAESMHLSATDEEFDTSQSYWTYWHWFDEIQSGWGSEIETGGSTSVANAIIRERGLMVEEDFIPEDTTSEMSSRQKSALDKINEEMKTGRLKTSTSRRDGKLVREVLDEAWGLSDEVRAELDQVFGEDGERTLRSSTADTEGTRIIRPSEFSVRYTARDASTGEAEIVDGNLEDAITEWRSASYPSWGSDEEVAEGRRNFLIRVQRALHDSQPVVVTWNVDFNAMESGTGPLRGSFNLQTLEEAGGPGRQGGHMTVLEDYEAETEEFGLLKAGETLDPANEEDARKLEAALDPSTEIKFLRIKNSWGAFRDDRASAPGFPGYHDLYMEYLNGPIQWCPEVEGTKDAENCTGESTPLRTVLLPPGY